MGIVKIFYPNNIIKNLLIPFYSLKDEWIAKCLGTSNYTNILKQYKHLSKSWVK